MKRSLTVATAANMQFVMKELSERFAGREGLDCEIVVSSSGILTAQIRHGAPYDVFVSADMKYPKEIYNSGLAASPPEIYAFGRLVLWTMDQNIQPSIGLLDSDRIIHIAIANPKTAPYGKAALDVLKHFDLYDELESKLVYGESIAQTNQFIISRAAEIGFTAKSVVLSPEMKGKGRWVELEDSSYDKIAQGIVIIKRNNKIHKDAGTFYDYIFSGEAQKILMNFGYDVSE